MNTINFNVETNIDRDKINAVVNEIKANDGIVIRVNALVARIVSGIGMHGRRMINYVDESHIEDGEVYVKLSIDEPYPFGHAMVNMTILIEERQGTIYRDNTGTHTNGSDFARIILASDFFGDDPRQVMIDNDGKTVPAVMLAEVGRKLYERSDSDDSIELSLFSPLTGRIESIRVALESEKVATKEYIESVSPMLRGRLASRWCSDAMDFLWSDSLGQYIHQRDAACVVTAVDDDGTIHTDFVTDTNGVMGIYNRYNESHRLVGIYYELARRLNGVTLGNGMTPIIRDNTFHFDKSHKEVVPTYAYHELERDAAEPIKSGLSIGFEVEKEDNDALYNVCAVETYIDTGWAKERDSSLDRDTGYELVSPSYDLMSDKLDKDLENDTLRYLINADYSSRCGGHIHVGHSMYSGRTLFDKVSPWVPLVYSLYVGRIGRVYCAVKKNDDIKANVDKYQAVRIFDDHIEFRIISAVKNVDTLLWRRDLMRIIMNNLSYTPMKIIGELLNEKSELSMHLRKQYTPSQITVKAKLYAYFAAELLDDAHAVKQHIMNAVDHFSPSQLRHLKSYSFNVNK